MASLKETMALLKGAKNKYVSGGGKTVKPKEGKNKIRLVRAEAKFWRDMGVHWIKPGEKEKPVAVVGCPFICYGKESPYETAIAKAIRAAVDDEQVKLYESWRARKSVIFPAIVLDGPDAGPEAQIYELTPRTFGQIYSIMETYAEEDVDIMDPVEGFDIIIDRRGKGFDTEYQVQAAPKSRAIDKEVLKKLPDLDAHIERELFRHGDEPKALGHIEAITGIKLSLPAPSGPREKAPLLTGPSADEMEEVGRINAEKADRLVAVAKKRAELEALEAGTIDETPISKVPTKAETPKVEPKAADTFGAAIDEDELNDVLKGLDDL